MGGIRRSVFGSTSEHELHGAIVSRWGDRFAVYPSLPFASIIGLNDLDLAHRERGFLYSTSVDFTLCGQRDGRPLLSIEFDGLSHGFSRAGRYVPLSVLADRDRAWKLDLKVRVATEFGYPFFVVSYQEKNPIGEGAHLSLVDGIIGQVFARQEFRRQLPRLLTEHRDAVEQLDGDARQEYVQGLVTDLESSLELEWDPLDQAAWRLYTDVHRRGIAAGHGVEWFTDPPLPETPPILDPGFAAAFEARVEAMKRTVWIGCRFALRTIFGDVQETARVRNLEHFAVSPPGLAENVAMFLACSRASALAEKRGKSSGEEANGGRW